MNTKDLIVIVLGLIAALMHLIAFYKYHEQTILGISHPPKATFLLWIFISTANLFTYLVMGDNWRLIILSTVSTTAVIVVFILFVRKNKLSVLDSWDLVALFLGIVALAVWSWYRLNRFGATFANLILQVSIIFSFIPLFRRFSDPEEKERGPLPWFIFSGAYVLQLVAVLIEKERYYMLFYPINCLVLHLIVGLLSLKAERR